MYGNNVASQMSRRVFVAGAASTAMVGAAGTALSTATPARADEAAAVDAWAIEELGEPTETIDADVCVLGAGGTGLAAAIQATQLGLKPVVLEKQAMVGGSFIGTEGLFAVGSHWEDEAGETFTADEVIIECELAVKPADPYLLRGKMEAAHTRRKKTQPLTLPSCGSVFKNPEGYSAGQLIEQAGLKGARAGGAQISEVHANFIVNRDNATAQDVLELINMARSKVYEAYGIELQPEVRFLGFA